MKAIFDQPCIAKESHVQLRSLLDSITKNLRSLKSLGEPIDKWDTLIIYIVTHKLDLTTRREWESFECQNKIPSMEDLNKFLKHRCEILEKIEINKSSTSQSSDPAKRTPST